MPPRPEEEALTTAGFGGRRTCPQLVEHQRAVAAEDVVPAAHVQHGGADLVDLAFGADRPGVGPTVRCAKQCRRRLYQLSEKKGRQTFW